jgi:hypothetical protein
VGRSIRLTKKTVAQNSCLIPAKTHGMGHIVGKNADAGTVAQFKGLVEQLILTAQQATRCNDRGARG